MESVKEMPILLYGYSKLLFSKKFSTTSNNRTNYENPLPHTSLFMDEHDFANYTYTTM
jgi:hypothetical protein